ncbi:MAG TPA: peroxiredoxin [Mycobacteriales bacterium]|nr:peroxiredoxin [Mycobacteriales bacterium]
MAGDAAPEFALRDQHGREQTLANRRGARHVLLVFYPFAFTQVCGGELRELRDNALTWDSLGADVLAVSCDPVPALREFSDREGIEFPLCSDFWPHGAVATAYDALEPVLGAAVRASFVIDRAGIVRWSVRNEIDTARRITDYVKALAEL